MKKIALLTTAMAGLFVLSGCSLIEKITDPEKEYDLADYKELLAGREFKQHPYATCSLYEQSKTESEEKSSTLEFTWNSELSQWVNEDGKYYTAELLTAGSLRDDVKARTPENSKGYTFYAKKKSYRITYKGDDEDYKYEFEWKYNEYGLVEKVSLTVVDLKALTTSEGSATATYSK